MTFDELKREAHAIAKEKGWWPETGRCMEDQWNCFHSEVSESWEEYRSGRPLNEIRLMAGDNRLTNLSAAEFSRQLDDDESRCKPEGFWVEVGDLVIRLADSAEANGWEFDDKVPHMSNCPPRQLILFLHRQLAREDNVTSEYIVSRVVKTCFACAKTAGVELWDVIKIKMNYNRTRSHRHGGKLA